MKANHNLRASKNFPNVDVSDTSKILKWKQITTAYEFCASETRCFRYFKDTKMKANHNASAQQICGCGDVSDTSKILKWKQITTCGYGSSCFKRCFRYFKDTKMKANHNWFCYGCSCQVDVSDTSKILKWKQITTVIAVIPSDDVMFPILQRY